jgi:transcriptional regulator with XRE-family HTH domain
MPTTKKWSEIRDKYVTPERRALTDRNVERAARSLRELRKARTLTQEQLVESLNMAQGDISRLERRADLYVSTLRRYIEAMGGQLDLVAHFPDGETIPIALAEFPDEVGTDRVPVA